MAQAGDVLLIGYGNPGRMDDGLGPALADAVEKLNLPGVAVDTDYQLTVEDAALVAQYDTVIFLDAAVEGEIPFSYSPIEPRVEASFSTHSIDPRAVVGLAHDLFGAKTKGYILGVRGYRFNDFGQGISALAINNLNVALKFLVGILQTRDFASGRVS